MKSLHSCLLSHDKNFLYELGVVQSSNRPARHTINEHWGLVCCYLPEISCAHTSMCRWESWNSEVLTDTLSANSLECQYYEYFRLNKIFTLLLYRNIFFLWGKKIFFLFAKVKSFCRCIFFIACFLQDVVCTSMLHHTRASFFWNSIRQVFKILTHFRWSTLKSLPIKSN